MQETTLAEVWPHISALLKEGFSVIPVRDKAEGDRPAKTPYGNWKQWQTSRMTEGELWEAMQSHNTSAIAVVCGEVSGRLELIDIDSKFEPGVEALLLKDIQQLYPDLYPLLRIHRTPSGGRHIIYRIEDNDVEGNQKLAGRESTEEEKAAQVKAGRKRITNQVNFLETRGEGGYFLYPPSLGYSIVQDVPVPMLTWEERCGLINLCRAYDRIVKVAPTPKPSKRESDWYITNPFEDFNQNCDPVQLIEDFGWKKMRHESSRFIWFTRPGKDTGVSASFNRVKRVFYIFTSSTELDPKRGYNPASILAELRFDGDRKKAFKHLVDAGYGEVKKSVEQSLLKKAAMQGYGVPNNFSDESKQDHAALLDRYAEDYPYGKFWELNKQGDLSINIEDFLHVSTELGFRSYNGNVVQINGKFVEVVQDVQYFDLMKDYIKEDTEEGKEIRNVYEKFLKTYGGFITTKRLLQFEDDEVLSDTADTCYKFYANCFVEITASNIRIKDYDSLTGYVWSNKIMNRHYNAENKASTLYADYLANSTSTSGRVENDVKNIIGWLCHDFNSPARIYIVVLTERALDPKDGGGSGKNIFVNLLSNMIGVSTASGAMVKWDDKFFAVWKPTDRIYFIPDLPKKVDWPFLKNAIENPLVNKKYDREISTSVSDAPKLILNTNFSFSDTDGGLKRRIRQIEFTDFYTVNGGVDTVHGKLFPSAGFEGDWTAEDWKGFDDMILHCIQYNLDKGGKLDRVGMSETGWIKKFHTMYGEDTYDFISDRVGDWVSADHVVVSEFQRQYDEYTSQLKERFKLGKKTLMSAVKEYCERFDIEFEQGLQKRVAHQNLRVHVFKGTVESVNVTDDEYPF